MLTSFALPKSSEVGHGNFTNYVVVGTRCVKLRAGNMKMPVTLVCVPCDTKSQHSDVTSQTLRNYIKYVILRHLCPLQYVVILTNLFLFIRPNPVLFVP